MHGKKSPNKSTYPANIGTDPINSTRSPSTISARGVNLARVETKEVEIVGSALTILPNDRQKG